MNMPFLVPFADISLPLWLVVSQWVLLFALGCLVIVAYRQLGYMLHLKEMGTEHDGRQIGEQAPAFSYTPMQQSLDASDYFDPKGKWSLLLFADPGCVSCQGALRALEHFAPEVAARMQILVATSADPALITAVEEFRTASVTIGRVDGEVPFKLYRTHATPFLYVIDAEGVIQAKGVAGNEAEFRKLVRKVDRNVVHVVPRSV